MNQKVISALVYLRSVLDEADITSLTVNMDSEQINVIALGGEREGDEIRIMYAEDYPINPIKDMLDHVGEEMCTDCLVFDESFKDPYFKSLTHAYVDALVHEFGLDIAIPTELGMAIVKHGLSEYGVQVHVNHDRDYFDYTLTKENVKDTEQRINDGAHVETWLFVEKEVEDVSTSETN